MVRSSRLSHLAPGNRRLIGLMQSTGFGTLEQVHVRHGDVRFDPAPVVTREIKLASEDLVPAPAGDFLLKRQHIELIEHLAQLGDGVVPLIEVKHGLPFRIFLRTAAA